MEGNGVDINQQVRCWVTEAFKLPKETAVSINERECIDEGHSSMDTVITVHSCKDHTHEYTISKLPADIKYEDIELLKSTDEHKHHAHKKPALSGYLFRFFIWWAGISGIYIISVACPCCGQVGCPVGIGSASLIGGLLALCKQSGKGFIKSAYNKLRRGGSVE